MQCYPFIHSDDPDCAEAADALQLVCAHDFPPQPLQWLWPDKIPLGKVTLLIGDPGTGKSLVTLDIAARASRGGSWPEANDETSDHSSFDIRHSSLPTNPQSEIHNPKLPPPALSPQTPAPSSTILLSASDDLADTIRPRLDAAGADPRRVFVIPSIANLRDDFKQLRLAVSRAPNCRLIIIDPINAYVGPSDSHFQTVVRKVLEPLAKLAAEKRIAVIAIAHLRKNEGDAIYRAAGSMGFVAAARAVWSVAHDPENPGRHLLLPVKNNLTPAACGLAYTIQQTGPLAAPTITWDSTPLAAKAQPKRSLKPSAERVEAREWLRHALAGGPRPATDVIDEGQQHGFLRRTLQRAFHELDGHTAKRGLHQGWWWTLTNQSAENQAGDCPNFAESSEQKVPAPFARDTPKTADIFEDVTYEHDIAAQQQLDKVLAARPPLSHSIATLERLDRQRRNDRRSNDPSNGKKRPPATTGHPILDAILNDLRKPASVTPLQPTPNTS